MPLTDDQRLMRFHREVRAASHRYQVRYQFLGSWAVLRHRPPRRGLWARIWAMLRREDGST